MRLFVSHVFSPPIQAPVELKDLAHPAQVLHPFLDVTSFPPTPATLDVPPPRHIHRVKTHEHFFDFMASRLVA